MKVPSNEPLNYHEPTGATHLSFSVVINTFNYGKFLPQAIASVHAQEYPRNLVQIVVVDDGSTDDTGEIARSYGRAITYIHQPNQGQATAITKGLEYATGDAVCLLDADDWFRPNKLKTLDTIFRTESVGAVYNRYDIVSPNGDILKPSQPRRLRTGLIRTWAKFWQAGGVPTSSISFTRDVASRIAIPASFRICADSFLLMAIPFLTTIGASKDSLTAYQSHGSNAFITLTPQEARKKLSDHADEIRLGMKEIYGVSLYEAPINMPKLMQAGLIREGFREFRNGVGFIRKNAGFGLSIKEYLKLSKSFITGICRA